MQAGIIGVNMTELLSKETLGLLYFLLPGFLAAWVFYGLTAHPKKAPFERSIQALIFTVVVQAIIFCIRYLLCYVGKSHRVGAWTPESGLIWSVIVAVAIGVTFSAIANSSCVHSLLQKLHVTKRTSYPSEWYSAFHHWGRHCVLNLKNGRRLRGWPEEWPDQPDKGHFLIQSPEWVTDEGVRVSLHPTMRVLIAAEDVEFVEFEYDPSEEKLTEDERTKIIESQKVLIALNAASAEKKAAEPALVLKRVTPDGEEVEDGG